MKKASRLAGAVLALSLVLPVSVGAETWVIDPAHTVSGFTVKHMMITNVTGVFEVTRGTIEYRPGDPGSVKADITLEARSVNTRIGRRDDDLRSDNFFSVEKFPTLAFRSRRVPPGASGKVFGFVYSGLDLGSCLVPVAFGWMLDHRDPRMLFVAVGVLLLCTIGTVVQVRRRAQPVPAVVTAATP